MIWRAAHALIGTRFRLHGRDPATGLDCVGLAAAALQAAGLNPGPVPTGYGLSDHDHDAIHTMMQTAGLVRTALPLRTGHIALYLVGHRQHHLAIIGLQSAVHAHAGLRRVVESPLPLDGQYLASFVPDFQKDN